MMMDPLMVVVLVGVVFVAGTITGIAGFGFAVVGTMALATVIDPASAVVFMIIPILAANVVLVRELSMTAVRTCGRRFAPLIVSTVVGTLLGMIVLDSVPDAPLTIALGVIALAFVASVQNVVSLPGVNRVKSGCFVETPTAMAGVGMVSGVLFGGTNVGVQLVAYLRSCNLSHGLFVGVIAMVFIGINTVRVGAAGVLGLYGDGTIAMLSVLAAVPAIFGVVVGKRVRGSIGPHQRSTIVLGLLTVIGVRLILGGLGIV